MEWEKNVSIVIVQLGRGEGGEISLRGGRVSPPHCAMSRYSVTLLAVTNCSYYIHFIVRLLVYEKQ